jgi:hypothetical protein
MPILHAVDVARVCYEVNRSYCVATGDNSFGPWVDAPQWQRDTNVIGVQYALDNPHVTPEDMHNSWMNKKIIDGWSYGEKKDAELKTHPALVNYSDLPEQQRLKDDLFLAVVNALRRYVEEQ